MRFCVLLPSGLILSTLLLACGGATAPAIGDGDGGSGSGAGAGSGSGGDTGGGGGGGGGADAAVDPVDAGPPDDPGEDDSDPGLIGCGATKCKSSGGVLGTASASYCCVERMTSTCKNAAVSACSGHRFLCDEAADCTNGVCCAEVLTSGGSARALSACRASCATGASRFQVCKTDDECEGSGSCKAYDCGNLFPGLRFCQKPDRCN